MPWQHLDTCIPAYIHTVYIRTCAHAYPEFGDSGPDACVAHVLLPEEVGIDTVLGVSDDQERAAHIAELHLFVEVVRVQLKSCHHLVEFE